MTFSSSGLVKYTRAYCPLELNQLVSQLSPNKHILGWEALDNSLPLYSLLLENQSIESFFCIAVMYFLNALQAGCKGFPPL